VFENRLRKKHLIALVTSLAVALSAPSSTWAQSALGSRVNGLISLDFSDHYITPRGLNVENQGVVAQPLTLLFWNLHTADKSALTDITLTTGLWNSFHSNRSGARPSKWNEIDPILGVTFKFRNRLKVDATTTSFYTPTDSYPTSTHLDLKLTYNDALKERVSFNPYVEYWKELNNKSTVQFNPGTSHQGSYFTVGSTPTFNLRKIKVEVDTYANFVSSDLYQRFDGSDGGSGLAVFSTYPKVSMPLRFLGSSYGAWTGYAGVTYLHLRNEGLLDGNQVLATSERKTNLARIRAGVSVFF
jgi:hypothetical protein